MELSLLFFNGAWDGADPEPYRLFHDAIQWADRHAFHSVWMPERHFATFGGLFPNPAVTAASVAFTTKRIGLRAGSVVAPFWDPIRIAEDWALVDNLSRGRAGVSFASGWHVNDFCLAPGHYERRREITLAHIDTVRSLWRGDTVRRTNGSGEDTEIRILPRPPAGHEIPIWLTATSDASIDAAAEHGLNLLLSIHHQKIGQRGMGRLEPRIERYRAGMARRTCKRGCPDRRGWVTLLVHTLVCDPGDLEDIGKPAYARYLETNLDLQAQTRDLSGLSPADRAFLIDTAVERMMHDAGLIGTVEHAREQICRFRRAGVDEVACLIDFGAPYDAVMNGLGLMADRLMDAAQ
jgi:natural product biosynthesis luciferase-like monooxygenase protein